MEPASGRSLLGRVALVSGASRGIGAAIARRLASEGAAVALLARTLGAHVTQGADGADAETLRGTAATIERDGGRALAIGVDLADSAARQRALGRVIRELGPIDVLVNNAALADGGTEAELRATYEVNVLAPLELIRRVAPGMRQRGAGWILNIGSVAVAHAESPFTDFQRAASEAWLHYTATKAALDRLTTGLAAVHGNANIALNRLAPTGIVVTSRLIEAWGAARIAELDPRADGVETLEAMAEAALALCTCNPAACTGRLVYCSALLRELGLEVRALDGKPLALQGSTAL